MACDIQHATLEDLDNLAQLFNEYRQYYGKEDDLALAVSFIRARLREGSSTLLLAKDAGEGLGFVQLYPSFSSVQAKPILILNDLFVTQDARCVGNGRALLEAAIGHARLRGIAHMCLATYRANARAQSLYESCGFMRDNEFFTYELDIK